MDYYFYFIDAVSQDLYDLIVSKLELYEYENLSKLRTPENYYNIIKSRYNCINRMDGKNYNEIFYKALLLLESTYPVMVSILRCRAPGDKIKEIKFIAEFLRDHLMARSKNYGDVIDNRFPDSWILGDNILNTDIILTSDPKDIIAGIAVKALFNYRYPYILKKYKEFGLNLDTTVKMMLLYARLNDISITGGNTNYGKILKYYISYKGNGSPILPGYDFDYEDWINYDESRNYRTLYKKYGILGTSYDQNLDLYGINHITIEDAILYTISRKIIVDNGDTYLTLFIILEKDFRYNPVDFENVLVTVTDVLNDKDSYTDVIKDKLLQRYTQYRKVL